MSLDKSDISEATEVPEEERDSGTPIEPTDVVEKDPESQIVELEGQVEHLKDQVLRRQAELINYRKRVERERADMSALAQAGVLERLLPIVDDFERAVTADTEDAGAFRQGVELILRSLENMLSGLGVERLEPLNETFDPEVHEAMARMETEDAPEGQVVEVFQPGYRIRDRLLRPARVVVASRPSDSEDLDEADACESSEVHG